MPSKYTVKGQIRDKQSGLGIPDLKIEAWAKVREAVRPRHVLRIRWQGLGCARTDTNGRFELEIDRSKAQRVRGKVCFKVYDADGDMVRNTRGEVDWDPRHPSEVLIEITVEGSEAAFANGVVSHRSGAEVPELVVRAFHRSLGKEETLGQAVTDEDGEFSISYVRRDPPPDLFVRVYPPASMPDKDSPLAVSEVRFDAKLEEIFELTIDAAAYRGPSEFDSVAAVLSPLLEDVELVDLTAEDVSLLAGKTSLELDHVTQYVAARIVAGQAELSTESIYGLLRSGFNAPLDSLLAHDGAMLTTALEDASGRNVVSLEIGEKATELADSMIQLGRERAAGIAPGALGELLAIAGLDEGREAERKQAVDLILAHRRGEDLRSAFRDAGFDEPTTDSVRLATELGPVTGGHPPLIKAIFQQADQRPRRLSELAWYPEDRWNELLDVEIDGEAVGVPEIIAGDTEAERRTNYVQYMQTILEAVEPTASIGAAMARADTNAVVSDFLSEYEDFDFAASHVRTFLSENNVAAAEDLEPELERLQRVYRITPVHHRYELMEALLAEGFDSAQKVARQTSAAFVKALDGIVVRESVIEIYRKARLFSSLALNAYIADAQGLTQPGLRVLPPWQPPWEPTGAGSSVAISASSTDQNAIRLANYSELFGSLDLCACQHCRSVLSPAAYLVDTLNWLSTTGPTPLDKLRERRPDLESLQLSCENTDTLLPYIDLVNEVLENAVASLNGKPVVAHDSSAGNSDELLSTPQHVNADAYDILAARGSMADIEKAAVYSASLPFDLWGSQARVFLAQLGVERWMLMRSFARDGEPTELEIATELLGMSTTERQLITEAAPDQRLWGFGSEDDWADVADALGAVPVFLERAGFTEGPGERFAQLLDLLHTRSANPGGQIRIHPEEPASGEPADICNLSHLTLEKDGDALTKNDLHRIQRFLRLWRRLDWTMLELDKVLVALGKTDSIDDDAIESLADISRIQAETRIDLLPLLSWWADVDSERDRDTKPESERIRSLYEDVFLNTALGEPVVSVFRPLFQPPPADVGGGPGTQPPGTTPTGPGGPGIQPPGTTPTGPGGPGTRPPGTTPTGPGGPGPAEPRKLADHEAEIQAALGITAADLDSIKRAMFVDDDGTTTWNEAELDLANLSGIYRVVSLSRALGEGVKPTLALRALTTAASDPVDPFAGAGQGSQFVREAREIHDAGFDLNDLLYVLEHDPDAALQLGPGHEQLALTLADLRTGLQQIDSELGVEVDASGERTRALLLEAGVPERIEGQTPEAALDELINVIAGTSTATESAQTALVEEHLGTFLDAAEAVASLVNDGIATDQPTLRFEYVQSAVASHLRHQRGRWLVEQSVASAVDLDVRSAADLVNQRIRSPLDAADPAVSIFLADGFINGRTPSGDTRIPESAGVDPDLNADDQAEAWTILLMLHKLAFLFSRLGINYDAQVWLFVHGIDWGLLDPRIIPTAEIASSSASDLYRAWKKLADLFRAEERLPGVRPSLPELLSLLIDDGGDFRSALRERTEWSSDDLDFVLDQSLGGMDDALHEPSSWHRLIDCFEILRRVGAKAQQVDNWRIADIEIADADDIRMAVRSRYEHAQWLEIARERHDELRERQRSALVAYLVAHDDAVGDANDLFGRYLIDVEMSACAKTSRIKQAISSVQLFVQRCFLGLEDDETTEIELGEDDAHEWKWRGNYRIWEANRKVFLYPENWIYPELRRDKSEFFEALESELLQNDITDENVEGAYLRYLEKLNDVARLDVRALFHEKEDVEGEGATDILHVFGRTPALPHKYYYRQLIDGDRWTPWESVDLDIEGEHLIPLVQNRRLLIFWPIITQETENEELGDRWLNAQLAWSEKRGDKWLPKRVSGWTLSSLPHSAELSLLPYTYRLEFTTAIAGKEVAIDFLGEGRRFGSFLYREGQGNLHLRESHERIEPHWDSDYHSTFYNFMRNWPPVLRIPMTSPLSQSTRLTDVLGRITPQSSIIYPRHYHGATYPQNPGWRFGSLAPFFVQDQYRTFFVIPVIGPSQSRWDTGWVKEGLSFGMLQSYLVTARAYDEAEFTGSPFDATSASGPVADSSAAIRRTASREYRGGDHRRAIVHDRSVSAPGGSPTDDGENGPAGAGRLRLNRTDEHLLAASRERDYLEAAIATDATYTFSAFYHPFVAEFITRIHRHGIDGLLAAKEVEASVNLNRQLHSNSEFFYAEDPTAEFSNYEPKPSVSPPYPIEDIDFDGSGAFASYNWELFFHVPFLIAMRLSQDQRFEDAMRWFHYIFEPMSRAAPGDLPDWADEAYARYWKVKPFLKKADTPIRELLRSEESRQDLARQIGKWEDQAFDPHVIAGLRPAAYQKAVVLKYLDNLIAWGDQLFRRDSIESINQATQLYVLVAEILGPRPEVIPRFATSTIRNFASLQASGLDEFSNVLTKVENILGPVSGAANGTNDEALPDLGPILYFCIPQNSKLVEYWDRVEDRLFKIRHCMNIEGIVRELPLFQPPIDPGLLVRAAAAGVDLSSVLSDLHAPLPHYRFRMMLEQAKTLNSTVRSLGGALLAALEKRDAEELALLRSSHEQNLLKAVREIRKNQIEEAKETLAATHLSQDVVRARQLYYQRLVDDGLNAEEQEQFDQLETALTWRWIVQSIETLSSVAAAVPQISYKWPGAPEVEWGGLHATNILAAAARGLSIFDIVHSHYANRASIRGGHRRRADDWGLQLESAGIEFEQLEKQIVTGEIRLAVAEKELDNHELQIANADAVDTWMRDKFTNRQLYDWMVGQISTLYFQSYQLAYDIAKRAEKCFQHELARESDTYIQFGYWDSLRKGLLAGDRLQHDLERMEAAYLEHDRREYELTKHVSLAMLNAVALVKLRQTGSCEFEVPEAIFDLDQPGHYLRRIKSVSLSIPAISGPFTGINGRLTLESSRIRRQPQSGPDGLELQPSVVQTVAISGGQNDSGLFELSHSDPRYLPFERRGAVSKWRFELTSALPEFDPQTIADVVLHLRYTAREGGESFRQQVAAGIAEALNTMPAGPETGLMRMISARHEFPNEWHSFLNPGQDDEEQKLILNVDPKQFPHFAQNQSMLIRIHKMDVVLILADPTAFRHENGLLSFTYSMGGFTRPASGEDSPRLEPDIAFGYQPHARIEVPGDGVRPETAEICITEQDITNLPEEYRVEVDGHQRLAADHVSTMVLVMHYSIGGS